MTPRVGPMTMFFQVKDAVACEEDEVGNQCVRKIALINDLLYLFRVRFGVRTQMFPRPSYFLKDVRASTATP